MTNDSHPLSTPALPRPLHDIVELAMNLRWSWNRRAEAIFEQVDPDSWRRAGHDPMKLLRLVPRRRLEELAQDPSFLDSLRDEVEDLRLYLSDHEPDALPGRAAPPGMVAYFSPEFGIGEALPIYSGGLGVLAGDHLKTASDLGIPLVGVGLLYRGGYFEQSLSKVGWQQESYPEIEPGEMALTRLEDEHGAPLSIEVALAGSPCLAAVWRADVGRVPLLLLDTDVPANSPGERGVTGVLYGGDSEQRLRQEILLGIGGVRALRAAGFAPAVFHSNEGHAGFLGLERIRELVLVHGLDFDRALAAGRPSAIFTTHTPVAAGIDIFETELMRLYFSSYAQECGTSFDRLMELGRAPHPQSDGDGRFNMAVMGFKLAAGANGVSRLHGEVSRSMFAGLWPDRRAADVPIGAITNGVHVPSWMGPEMAELIPEARPSAGSEEAAARRSAGPEEEAESGWSRILDVSDDELWAARRRARGRLVGWVRARLAQREGDSAWVSQVLDPEVLTVGFARRFAPYKRGTLLLHDTERLLSLLLGERPIQIVMAGKAHPRDEAGKDLIKRIVGFASQASVRARFIFLEGYDMELGRILTQGADVWLNHPRRPLEACGTSGMKAAINGVINCSVLDGWWDECYDGDNGWAIGGRDVDNDPEAQDRAAADSLYTLLENEIVPLFYRRAGSGAPVGWTQKMRTSVASLGGAVSSERMLQDYVTQLYEPAAAGDLNTDLTATEPSIPENGI